MKGKMIVLIMIVSLLCLVGIYSIYQKIEQKTQEWESVEVYENVYIFSGQDKEINFFYEGKKETLALTNPLSQKIEQSIADIEIHNKVVTLVRIKPDIIKGKVLSVSENSVEIDGYSELSFAPKCKIYQLSSGTTEIDENTSVALASDKNITVGNEKVSFVVAHNQICGVIVPAAIKPEKDKSMDIRVAIKTDGFNDYYHKKVVVTSEKSFKVTMGDKVKAYEAKQTVELSGEQRIKVKGDAKLQLLSITRNGKHPSYRGTLEVRKKNGGYIVINDLSLEEYLYAVVPSEMPTSYGKEALMVQSICARSYAYKQILENDLRAYGANVDDSVSYQVYNNTPENKASIEAVNATKGQILKAAKDVACTYFFSTSCGYTTGSKYTGFTSSEIGYLSGKSQREDGNNIENLSDENKFRAFIEKSDIKTYDSSFPWYRWKTSISFARITANINASLSKRIAVNPGRILVKNSQGNFVQMNINTVGTVKGIYVRKRGTGGVVVCLEIVGSEHTIRINNEYNSRLFLAPNDSSLMRKDGSKISGLTLLPSGFFAISQKEESIQIVGGGYGHGVGMSQNGVKRMVELGKNYKEILSHYYPGTTLSSY